jgi:hypothetical protein
MFLASAHPSLHAPQHWRCSAPQAWQAVCGHSGAFGIGAARRTRNRNRRRPPRAHFTFYKLLAQTQPPAPPSTQSHTSEIPSGVLCSGGGTGAPMQCMQLVAPNAPAAAGWHWPLGGGQGRSMGPGPVFGSPRTHPAMASLFVLWEMTPLGGGRRAGGVINRGRQSPPGAGRGPRRRPLGESPRDLAGRWSAVAMARGGNL